MEARQRSTARLRLVAATPAIVRADLESRVALQKALGVAVPENWPPQYYDAAAIATSLQWLESHPHEPSWTSYYIVRTDLPAPQLTGIVGYRGAPTAGGTVEIGYSLLAQHQRLGLATEAAG